VKKLRSEQTQGMLAIIRCRLFCLPVFNLSETWSLTLTERESLKVYENRVLRNIFGPEGQEVVEEWRRIHSKELYDIYFSPHIIRVVISRIMR
jgi:hypothetical protein